MASATMQLGKKGLTENFVESLRKAFNTRENVKVSVLKSATRDRQELREIADKLVSQLGKNFTYRIVGFTIFIKKWRKPPKKRASGNTLEEQKV